MDDEDRPPFLQARDENREDGERMACVVGNYDVRLLHLPPDRPPAADGERPARTAEEPGRHGVIRSRVAAREPAGEDADVTAAIQQDSTGCLDELLDTARVR